MYIYEKMQMVRYKAAMKIREFAEKRDYMTTERETFQKREKLRQQRKRRRMKRVRRIKRIGICLLGSLIFAAALVMTRGKMEDKKTNEEVEAMRQQDTEEQIEGENSSNQAEMEVLYLEELTAMKNQDDRIEEVIANAEEYPFKVLRMLAKNTETLDFVLDYPEKKDLPCEISIGESPLEGEIPLLIQWDERWGYGAYGDSIVATSGCGPTCIAMVASGLTGRNDITPYTVAAYSESSGFLSPEMDTSWALMTYGCEAFGITGTMLGLDESAMINTLANGCPIICSMGPGDFTDNGHFIVLTAYENGEFQIHDPNSKIRSGKRWSYETLKDQIVNMWYYTSY